MTESDKLLSIFLGMFDEEDVREHYIRAPFPFPGGKSRAIHEILPKLPYRKSYIESHGGSGAVLLSRRESPLEVFNDRYSGVTCFYRVIREKESFDKLTERLSLLIHSREEFIWCRETWKNVDDDVERAARWWYCVTCSFGAQGRHFGRSTNTGAQMGSKLKGNLELFQPVHNRMINVQVENQDWRQCFKDYDSEDAVFYVDPTYYKT